MERANTTQVIVVGVAAGTLLAVAVMARAQTVTPPVQAPPPVLSSPSSTTTSGASERPSGTFDQLSPGNKTIARAIFEAQKTSTTGTSTGTGTGTTVSKTLTLDQIAAMKQSGRGWGEIFNDLKKQGLVQDKNLGQAVSRFEKHHGGDGAGGATTSIGKHDGDDRGGSRQGGSDSRSHASAFSDGRGNGFADRGFSSGSGGGFGGGNSGGHGGGRGR